MKTNIQIFTSDIFGEIRTCQVNNQIMFVAKDVATALGYANTPKAIRDHIDDDDKLTERFVLSGQARSVVIINESGLYALVLSSKLPQAREFKRWVTSEVLPQIRQTGGYIPTTNPRTGEVLTESEMVEAANKIVARTIARSNLPADDCLTATQVAESLDVDVKQLNHFLVDKGVMYWSYGRYKLTAKYADCGYAEERKFHYHALNGARKQRPYLVWTKQGKEFIKSIYR